MIFWYVFELDRESIDLSTFNTVSLFKIKLPYWN